MDRDTVGSDEDAYWRRRVIALGGALAIVGLVVWACSPSGGHKRAVRNAAAVSSPSPTPGVGVGVPSAAGTAMPTVTVTATALVTVTPMPSRRAGDACEARDVVVTLRPGKDVYGSGERPRFQVTVVNTGAQACTFGVGPKELAIEVSSGSDKVWSTGGRCPAGTGSSIQMLQRGVPFGGVVDWDRHRSPVKADCSGARGEVHPGAFTVVAKGGGIKTRRVPFRLR